MNEDIKNQIVDREKVINDHIARAKFEMDALKASNSERKKLFPELYQLTIEIYEHMLKEYENLKTNLNKQE